MTIDYRTLLGKHGEERWATTFLYDAAATVLATRLPDLCSDCNEHGMRWMGRVTDDGDGPWVHCTHPNAPTIADLLHWGENVARGDSALTLLHAMDDTPVPYKYEMTGRDLEVLANACLAALRTEADR